MADLIAALQHFAAACAAASAQAAAAAGAATGFAEALPRLTILETSVSFFAARLGSMAPACSAASADSGSALPHFTLLETAVTSLTPCMSELERRPPPHGLSSAFSPLPTVRPFSLALSSVPPLSLAVPTHYGPYPLNAPTAAELASCAQRSSNILLRNFSEPVPELDAIPALSEFFSAGLGLSCVLAAARRVGASPWHSGSPPCGHPVRHGVP